MKASEISLDDLKALSTYRFFQDTPYNLDRINALAQAELDRRQEAKPEAEPWIQGHTACLNQLQNRHDAFVHRVEMYVKEQKQYTDRLEKRIENWRETNDRTRRSVDRLRPETGKATPHRKARDVRRYVAIL
jgi:glutamyl-tRNA reductase